jgi:hypothetical protein
VFWGAHAPSRAGFGASPKPTWHGTEGLHPRAKKKVRDDEGVVTSTRGACAPQMRASPRVMIAANTGLLRWLITLGFQVGQKFGNHP